MIQWLIIAIKDPGSFQICCALLSISIILRLVAKWLQPFQASHPDMTHWEEEQRNISSYNSLSEIFFRTPLSPLHTADFVSTFTGQSWVTCSSLNRILAKEIDISANQAHIWSWVWALQIHMTSWGLLTYDYIGEKEIPKQNQVLIERRKKKGWRVGTQQCPLELVFFNLIFMHWA